MRVCMLAYTFYESDARVRQYAKALVRRGDLVDVVALRRKGQSKYEVIDRVNVYRIQLRVVDERGPLQYLFKILLFFFRAAIFLTRRHLACRYQVVHVHSVPDFLVFAALVPRLTGTPVILDIHDILPEFYASKFTANSDSLLFKFLLLVEKGSTAFSDHVIIANHLWYERLVSRSVKRAKCTTICNYPDTDFFSPRTRLRSDNKFVIIYPGSLNPHQGLDVAIRALARIQAQAPDIEMHIYGEGPAKDALIQLTHELGLNGKVSFGEALPSNQISKLMAEADLAVVPKRATSPFGNEAASTKIPEFMALNIPVIISRTKIDTYYYDDSMVKFFDSDDDADLARSILLLRNDKELRERLVLKAAAWARQNNWDIKRTDYLNLVDSLVARLRGRERCEATPTD